MGHGFSPTGALTGGLAGPASILQHPNIKNLVGGGAFADLASRGHDGSKSSSPAADPTKVTTNTQKNPLSLNTAAINTPNDIDINNSLRT